MTQFPLGSRPETPGASHGVDGIPSLLGRPIYDTVLGQLGLEILACTLFTAILQ